MTTARPNPGPPTDDVRMASSTAKTPAATMAFGLVFLAIGIIGFFITGFDDFFDHHTGEKLLWFEINPAHNIVHLLFGVLGLALSKSVRGAMTFGIIVGVGYTGALIYGLIADGEDWDFLSINSADNVLHLVLAALGFVLAAAAAQEARESMDAGAAGVPPR